MEEARSTRRCDDAIPMEAQTTASCRDSCCRPRDERCHHRFCVHVSIRTRQIREMNGFESELNLRNEFFSVP